LERLRKAVAPGITTRELDQIGEEVILSRGAIPAFKGYRGYPRSVCVSINEEVVHGIPNQRRWTERIVSHRTNHGYFGMAISAGGEVDPGKETSRYREGPSCRDRTSTAGNRLFDISYAIQTWVESHGFSVVRDFVGHGIGKNLHEEPQIPILALTC
jgi:methionyl aminopeptidase